MSKYRFMLPWPPTVNHFHQPVVIKGRARCIKSAKVREYESKAIGLLKQLGVAGEGVESRLQVYIILEPPTARKYDVDNRTKAVFDALTYAGFWLDDEQVDLLVVEKGKKRKGGNVIVEVTEL